MTSTRKIVADAKKAMNEKRLGPGTTRYDRFCAARGIDNRTLAKHSGYTAKYHRAVRYGISEPTMEFVADAVRTVRRIAEDKTINAEQLFDLEGDDEQ